MQVRCGPQLGHKSSDAFASRIFSAAAVHGGVVPRRWGATPIFGNHYKINIQIRKKLGLDSHSTNLNLYITRLLRESEELPAPADDGG